MSANAKSGCDVFWRWASPSKLICSLIVFCFPWINVKCNYIVPSISQAGRVESSSHPVASQSGFQASYGGYADYIPPGLGDPHPENHASLKKPASSPLLWLYAISATAGVLAGLIMRRNRRRLVAIATASAVAFVAITIQCQINFPIAKSVEEENASWYKSYREKQELIGSGKASPDIFDYHIVVVSFTGWYYLAFVFPAAALYLVMMEALLCRRAPDNGLVTSQN